MFFKKKIVPKDNNEKEVSVVQLWEVRWVSRYDNYSFSTRKECEVFPSEQDATDFKDSLKKAFALIKHTGGNNVELIKRQ